MRVRACACVRACVCVCKKICLFHAVVRKQCSLNEPVAKPVFCISTKPTQCNVIRVPKYKVTPTQSRRDQEVGGEMDSHEEARHVCGSRRDQEEGGGAGPSREPRRDQEEGGGAGLRKLDFFCFGCFSTAVLRTVSL